MRYYTPLSLAAEYRRRHFESIAVLLELMDESCTETQLSLCISTDGKYGDFIYIEDPFSFFQKLLFKEEGRRMVISPFSIPAVEESCRDILFLMHNGYSSMH